MTFVVYNGSYISEQNTGLGVVSNEIYKNLDKNKYFLLNKKYDEKNLIKSLHFKRQLWMQFEVPKL